MADSTAVTVLRDELVQAHNALLDPIEGLHDFAREFKEEEEAGRVAAESKAAEYEERVRLINVVLDALEALTTHGYPDVAPLIVDVPVFNIFQDNVRTQAAAFSLVQHQVKAETAKITAQTPTPAT